MENIIEEVSKNSYRIFQIKTLSAPTKEVINKISLKPQVSNIIVIGNTLEFEYSGTDDQLAELVN